MLETCTLYFILYDKHSFLTNRNWCKMTKHSGTHVLVKVATLEVE